MAARLKGQDTRTIVFRTTAYDGVVQHDRDMQHNSCRVEISGWSVELDDRGAQKKHTSSENRL